MNIDKVIQITDDELYEYLKSLTSSNKREIWNEISKNNPDRIRSLSDFLKLKEVTKTVSKGPHKGETRPIMPPSRKNRQKKAFKNRMDLRITAGCSCGILTFQLLLIGHRRHPANGRVWTYRIVKSFNVPKN